MAFRPNINSKGLNKVDSCLDALYAKKHVSINSSQLSSFMLVHFVIACIVWSNFSTRPVVYDRSIRGVGKIFNQIIQNGKITSIINIFHYKTYYTVVCGWKLGL